MIDFAKEAKDNPYKKEIQATLERIEREMPAFNELDYFFSIVRDHYLTNFEASAPDIAVLGSGVPEELVFAAAKRPYWVLGGSRISSLWADELTPRDTDPVSRSALGFIKSRFGGDTLILVPLVNDSARKLTYILQTEGLKVHPLHFPPMKDDAAIQEWERQCETARRAIALHLKRPLTERLLRETRKTIRRAKAEVRDFFESSEGLLRGSGRMLIRSSYYCVSDLAEWSRNLENLTTRLRRWRKPRGRGESKVLLLGSPVYFPNYKVPFLIEDSGLEIGMQADYTTLSQENGGFVRGQRTDFAEAFFRADASPAYVRNDALYGRIAKLVSRREIDGVVYHVLKGQTEYDFELGRFEELFERLNVPVFRLETDYNQQDVEQLRIRLEAFSEVLHQRHYTSGGIAV